MDSSGWHVAARQALELLLCNCFGAVTTSASLAHDIMPGSLVDGPSRVGGGFDVGSHRHDS